MVLKSACFMVRCTCTKATSLVKFTIALMQGKQETSFTNLPTYKKVTYQIFINFLRAIIPYTIL